MTIPPTCVHLDTEKINLGIRMAENTFFMWLLHTQSSKQNKHSNLKAIDFENL
jgi:hypothetical protein